MEMTPADICASYRRADNKKAQIQILAELNAVPPYAIREILESQGINPDQPTIRPYDAKKNTQGSASLLRPSIRIELWHCTLKASRIWRLRNSSVWRSRLSATGAGRWG